MRDWERLSRLLLECMPELDIATGEERDSLVRELTPRILKRFGRPNLPNTDDTVAVALDKPKTASLFFDRIWWAPGMEGGPPDEMTVFGATDIEVWPLVVVLSLHPPTPVTWARVAKAFSDDTVIAELWAKKAPAAKNIADALFLTHEINAVPMYNSTDDCLAEYSMGKTEIILAAVENLGIVNETNLEWRQIMDFRDDRDARAKLRRMRHWFDTELIGKPMSYVTDALATRLEDYEWALKKHGIETVTGSLSDLLDVRFLPAASAITAGFAVAAGSFWAAIGATGLTLGKAALSITTRLVDLKDRERGQNSEVAFIHELKKISKESPR
jgi:hypothetical protein